MRRFLTSRPIYPMTSLASTPVIVSTTSVALPNSWIPNGASGAFICCDTLGGGVKIAFGSDPNTLWGIGLSPGQMFEIHDSPEMLSSIRFVRVSGTDGRISLLPFVDA